MKWITETRPLKDSQAHRQIRYTHRMRALYRWQTLGAFLVLFSAAAQCGGRNEQSMPVPRRAPESPPSPLALTLAQAQCDYLARCDPDAMHMFASGSRQACLDFFACENNLPWPLRTVPGPASMLETCVESLRSRECPDKENAPLDRFSYGAEFPFGPSCGFPITLPPPPDAPDRGEACLDGFGETRQCGGDNYCASTPASRHLGSFSCGVCAPLIAVGDSCDASTPCTANARCTLGRCTVPQALGQACTDSDDCFWRACEGGVCGRSIYAPDPYEDVIGRECIVSPDCGHQAGLRCDGGRCRPLGDEGDACSTLPISRVGPCRLGQYCVNGRCTALGCTLDVGEPCSFSCYQADCVDGVCGAPGESVGAPCENQCGAGLGCVQKRCENRGNGAACDFDFDCDSGFCQRDVSAYCDGGSCSISACNRCGVCADVPTAADCK